MAQLDEIVLTFRCEIATYHADEVIRRMHELHELLHETIEANTENEFVVKGTGDINYELRSRNK